MENGPSELSTGKQRVFLRIPSRLRARIILPGEPEKEVTIDEISTTGLSFSLKQSTALPQLLEITFRLPGSLKMLQVEVEVKNRQRSRGREKLGCRLVRISEQDKQLINDYIIQLADFSLPCLMLGIASFFLAIDALWRLFVYLAIMHYSKAPFLEGFAAQVSPFYIFTLCSYTFICCLAMISSDDMRKNGFLTNISCVALAFTFIFTKTILYWKMHLDQSRYVMMNPYAWIQFSLVIYTGLALFVGLAYLRRIVTISEALEEHRREFMVK